ncbi:MAG: efflux RND transporter periplasmic adaptor subunit, partial [Elusimicrobiales bacterium]|nr:efflux RND transporter periplasmic adaptor subunit [Elusimicrobiales bacterium]
MKKMLKIAVWLALVLVAAAGGVWGYRRYKKMMIRQDIGEFLRQSSKGDLKLDLQESGELVSRDTVDVFPPNKGFVVEIFKREGEYVEKGDKLMMVKGGERMESDQYVPVP